MSIPTDFDLANRLPASDLGYLQYWMNCTRLKTQKSPKSLNKANTRNWWTSTTSTSIAKSYSTKKTIEHHAHFRGRAPEVRKSSFDHLGLGGLRGLTPSVNAAYQPRLYFTNEEQCWCRMTQVSHDLQPTYIAYIGQRRKPSCLLTEEYKKNTSNNNNNNKNNKNNNINN